MIPYSKNSKSSLMTSVMSTAIELKERALALGSANAATGTADPAIFAILSRQSIDRYMKVR
jgi:hypothetical protein